MLLVPISQPPRPHRLGPVALHLQILYHQYKRAWLGGLNGIEGFGVRAALHLFALYLECCKRPCVCTGQTNLCSKVLVSTQLKFVQTMANKATYKDPETSRGCHGSVDSLATASRKHGQPTICHCMWSVCLLDMWGCLPEVCGTRKIVVRVGFPLKQPQKDLSRGHLKPGRASSCRRPLRRPAEVRGLAQPLRRGCCPTFLPFLGFL